MPAKSEPADDEHDVEIVDTGTERVKVPAAAAEKLRASGRMQALNAKRWSKGNDGDEVEVDPDVSLLSTPSGKAALAMMNKRKELMAEKALMAAYTQQDPQTAAIVQQNQVLREELARRDRETLLADIDARFAQLEGRMSASQALTSTKENGGSLSDQLVKVLLERALRDPAENAQSFLKTVESYANAVKGSNEFDLEKLKLQLRASIYNQERMDRIQGEAVASERSTAQLRELIELGRSAITDAVRPLTSAVGDGLRSRIANAPLPPQPGVDVGQPQPQEIRPIPFARMSPEQRQDYKKRLAAARRVVDARERELAAAEGRNPEVAPGVTVTPAKRRRRPDEGYGEVHEPPED